MFKCTFRTKNWQESTVRMPAIMVRNRSKDNDCNQVKTAPYRSSSLILKPYNCKTAWRKTPKLCKTLNDIVTCLVFNRPK